MKNIVKTIKYYARVVYFVSISKHTNIMTKLLGWITISYAFSPIDLIPDFIPLLGLLDDLVILPALVGLTLLFVSKEALFDAKERAKSSEKIEKKWYYALFVIVLWFMIIMFVLQKVN